MKKVIDTARMIVYNYTGRIIYILGGSDFNMGMPESDSIEGMDFQAAET